MDVVQLQERLLHLLFLLLTLLLALPFIVTVHLWLLLLIKNYASKSHHICFYCSASAISISSQNVTWGEIDCSLATPTLRYNQTGIQLSEDLLQADRGRTYWIGYLLQDAAFKYYGNCIRKKSYSLFLGQIIYMYFI